MNRLCNPIAIKGLLARHGFKFSKALGQNFLINEDVPANIAKLSGAGKDSGVIEIGPGIGVLTVELSKIAKKVVAIELDERLLPILKETLEGYENISVINADVLKVDIRELIKREFADMDVYVCANLPYYITTPIITSLLEQKLPIKSITLMVQKEVASRLCATPGTRQAGSISLFVSYLTQPSILMDVPASCFMPQPKVDSSVIRLDMRSTPAVELNDEKFFFRLIKAAFAQRRKTLCNAVSSSGLPIKKEELVKVLSDMGLKDDIRAERLTIEEFAKLSNKLWQNMQQTGS